MRASVFLIAGLSLAVLSAQQKDEPPVPRTAAITGVVVDGSTGSPVSGALVYLHGPGPDILPSQTRQLTDDRGRFAFINLRGDQTYLLQSSKFGYIDGGFGRDVNPTDPIRPIPLKPDEWAANLKVTIWRPGVITGVVRDENGEPVVGVIVRSLMRIRLQGREELAAGPMTLTDDRGEYRLAGLGPGRHVIQVPSVQASIPAATPLPSATASSAFDLDDTHRIVINRYPLPPPPGGGRRLAYPLIFHPSTSVISEAEAIDLKYGEERTAIDITLRPTASVRVSGVVEGPTEAITALTLRLLPVGLENVGIGSEAATALVGGDGRFTFYNVPSGNYVLDAPVRVSELSTTQFVGQMGGGQASLPMPPPGSGWSRTSYLVDSISGVTQSSTGFRSGTPAEYSARMPVTVGNTDMNNVLVRLRQHATMELKMVIERDPNSPARFVGSFSLDPATSEAYLGRPSQRIQNPTPVTDDVGTITGIIPGQYWVRQNGSASYVIKSVTVGGRDHTTTPIEVGSGEALTGVVTITNLVAQLLGTVRSTDELKTDATMVVLFPAEATQWRNAGFWPARMKSTVVSTTGAYRFPFLPAGEYYAAAISRSHSAVWRDPQFLAQVARSASRVTLTWGGTASIDLTPVVIR